MSAHPSVHQSRRVMELQTIVLIFLGTITTKVNCWGIKSEVEFEGRPIPSHPLFQEQNRYEYSERNTSAAYTIWDEVGLKWIEWPGNITKLDLDFPVLTWRRKRAKLIGHPCNSFLAVKFLAYAYKHVHLTYGSFRLTASYCPPLSIPRSILPGSATQKKSVFISVSDFAFVPNDLLVIVEDRSVIRVGPLGLTYREEGTWDVPALSYGLAKGITSKVDRLVSQNCCKRDLCNTGEVVLAYEERSPDFVIFVSTDAGINFKQIQLSRKSSILHAVLPFPTENKVLAVHGSETKVILESFSMQSGKSLENNSSNTQLDINGFLQAVKFGQEMSLAIWDKCRVWYSKDQGKSLTEANFYINSKVKGNAKRTMHSIGIEHCFFSSYSAFAFDDAGKVGLIDSQNNFFYGIDTKSAVFNLVATNLDLSRMISGTENSVVPHFDFNNRPKLMYPAKFLRVDHPAVKDKSYAKRLAMRLYPRSVFPSDFMPPFYVENIPSRYKYLGFQKCESSGLSADSSISQKPKLYKTSELNPLTFDLEFRTVSNLSNQLRFEPTVYSSFLEIGMKLLDNIKLGLSNWYYYKYRVSVRPRYKTIIGRTYRLNLYTRKSIRCVHQPQLTVWVQVEKDENNPPTAKKPSTDTMRYYNHYLSGEEISIDKTKIPMDVPGCTGRGHLPSKQK